jgi:hypothetical protein
MELPHCQAKTGIRIIGALILLSSLIVNPWLGIYYREDFLNYVDVMESYFYLSLIISGLMFALAELVFRKPSNNALNCTVMIVTISLLFLSDRLILAWIGLPYWIPDAKIHYRHRPNTTRLWKDLDGTKKALRINSHGHHDDEFPIKKRGDEFRGLMIGDSITMGDGVSSDETFSNQLEGFLQKYGQDYQSYQIINAGVQGYSTSQELQILKESMRFKPDFIAIGFCMNDVTMPYEAIGNPSKNNMYTTAPHIDISLKSGIQTTSSFLRYALNDTGYGRLIQKMRASQLQKEGGDLDSWSVDTQEMSAASATDPRFRKGWNIVLQNLHEAYALAKENNIPIVLLIFPNDFQLFNESLKKPQDILTQHAQEYGVDCIDFTQIFEKVFQSDIVDMFAKQGKEIPPPAELNTLYELQKTKYLRDFHHLTPVGHHFVASVLNQYLHVKGIVQSDLARFQIEWDQYRHKNISNYRVTVNRNFNEFLRKTTALRLLGEMKLAIKIYENSLGFYEDMQIKSYIRKELSDTRKEIETMETQH